ncbi:hypothetical protein MIDIC_490012 [Alphaproteobacteria bacterium]
MRYNEIWSTITRASSGCMTAVYLLAATLVKDGYDAKLAPMAVLHAIILTERSGTFPGFMLHSGRYR